MLSRVATLFALAALLLAAPVQAQRNGQISITYEKVDGANSVAVIEMSGQAGEGFLPFDAGPCIALLTSGTDHPHTWTTSEWRVRDGVATTQGMIPAPDQIVAILVPVEGGGWMGWNIEEGAPTYSKVEWTVLAATEAEEEEPEPSTAGSCTGIVDPWTGECQEEIRDAWGSEVLDESIILRF